MKYKSTLALILSFPIYLQAQYNSPQSYQSTYNQQLTNPSQVYTNTTKNNPAGTANLPGNDTSLIPTATQLLEQVYPPPPQQQTTGQQTATSTQAGANQQPETPKAPLKVIPWQDQNVAPLESWLPGIATIKGEKWIVSDYFYNLSSDISIKIDIVHPRETRIPISEMTIDKIIRSGFESANIRPQAAQVLCQPALPTLYVLVMAYPCERSCVGFVSMQLFEKGKPSRIDVDLDGVWQIVSWARQGMVVSSCEEFPKEISSQIEEILDSFLKTFQFYHAPEHKRPCFPLTP